MLLFRNNLWGQYRIGLGPELGLAQNILNNGTKRYGINPISGIRLEFLCFSRVGLHVGYYHSNVFDKIEIPSENMSVRFETGIRQIPLLLQIVVFKNSKDLYSRVTNNDVLMVSLICGFQNTREELAFAKIKNQTQSLKVEPEQLQNTLNSFSNSTYQLEYPTVAPSFQFLSSPTFGVKIKFKDYKSFSSYIETNYIIENKNSSFFILTSNDMTYRQDLKRQSIIFKFGISYFLETDYIKK